MDKRDLPPLLGLLCPLALLLLLLDLSLPLELFLLLDLFLFLFQLLVLLLDFDLLGAGELLLVLEMVPTFTWGLSSSAMEEDL